MSCDNLSLAKILWWSENITNISLLAKSDQIPVDTIQQIGSFAKNIITECLNLESARQNFHNPNKRYREANNEKRYCHWCGTTKTPEWRRDPDGPKTLCKACGLERSKRVKLEYFTSKIDGSSAHWPAESEVPQNVASPQRSFCSFPETVCEPANIERIRSPPRILEGGCASFSYENSGYWNPSCGNETFCANNGDLYVPDNMPLFSEAFYNEVAGEPVFASSVVNNSQPLSVVNQNVVEMKM